MDGLSRRSTPSPVGTLVVTGSADGLRSVSFTERDGDDRDGEGLAHVLAAVDQLRAYFARGRRAFDLPLAPEGTPFQREVWGRLREVPFGETTSYGALARGLGKPGGARAVGLANGQNPLAIVVPCHRVIGSGGDLTGYAGGLWRKTWLLNHERGAPSLFG